MHVWKDAAAGAVGGLVGTAFIRMGTKASQRLPEPLQPPELIRDPAEAVTEKAEEMAGRPLPPRARAGLQRNLGWIYGVFWPTALGAALRGSPLRDWRRALAAGVGLGTGVWAVGYLGWLPALRIVEPLSQRKVARQATNLASHVGYGILAVAPLWLAARYLRPRRRRRLLSYLPFVS